MQWEVYFIHNLGFLLAYANMKEATIKLPFTTQHILNMKTNEATVTEI